MHDIQAVPPIQLTIHRIDSEEIHPIKVIEGSPCESNPSRSRRRIKSRGTIQSHCEVGIGIAATARGVHNRRSCGYGLRTGGIDDDGADVIIDRDVDGTLWTTEITIRTGA